MQSNFIDLSHDFEDGMPGFRLKNPDGSLTTFTARIRPFLTHEQTKIKYQGKASFEITEITFQTSIGTYLDAPYHRFPEKRDISQIFLEEVILPGVVVDARNLNPSQSLNLDMVDLQYLELETKAVLFNFGWDKFWGTEQYFKYPFLSIDLLDYLITRKIKLVGVDTINIDDSSDLSRPAHTKFLSNDILIVENLTNLESLYNEDFRFFAVPLKAKHVAALPVRAFAEII